MCNCALNCAITLSNHAMIQRSHLNSLRLGQDLCVTEFARLKELCCHQCFWRLWYMCEQFVSYPYFSASNLLVLYIKVKKQNKNKKQFREPCEIVRLIWFKCAKWQWSGHFLSFHSFIRILRWFILLDHNCCVWLCV